MNKSSWPVTKWQVTTAVVILTLLGVGYTIEAIQLPLGDPPGSGSASAPLLFGISWVLFGIIVLLRPNELFARGESIDEAEPEDDGFPDWPSGEGGRKLILLLALSGLFLVAMLHLGTIVSSFLLLASISWLFGGSLRQSIFTSAAISAAIWFIFIYLLQMRLPAGILI